MSRCMNSLRLTYYHIENEHMDIILVKSVFSRHISEICIFQGISMRQPVSCPLLTRDQIWAQSGSDWPQMGQIRGVFHVVKSDVKKCVICPICVQSGQVCGQVCHWCWMNPSKWNIDTVKHTSTTQIHTHKYARHNSMCPITIVYGKNKIALTNVNTHQ